MASNSFIANAHSTAIEAALHADAAETDAVPTPVNHQARDPFATPYASPPVSRSASTTQLQVTPERRYFHSRRIKKGTVERPWLDKKDPREKWVTIIPLIGIFIGLAITAALIWDGLRNVVNHEYCPVLIEDFSKGLDPAVWTKEAEVGGFGYAFLVFCRGLR